MTNPVDVLVKGKKTGTDNYRFPSTLGSRDRGEDKFTFFLVKEILKGGDLTTIGTIALPMPTNLIDDYKVEYADATLGPIGATAVGVGSQIADDYSLDSVGKALKGGLRSVNRNMLGQVVAKKAIEMIPGISTGDAKATAGQIVTSATNMAVNPYNVGVFKSVGFKSFNFTFKLFPLNQDDTDHMNDVIKFFKSSMLPEDEVIPGQTAHPDFTYQQKTGLQTLPHRFSISFQTSWADRTKGRYSEYMFKVEDAALSSFSVNYEGEGGPSFFKKTGAPMSAELNMTFMESKIHTRERDESMYGGVIGNDYTESGV